MERRGLERAAWITWVAVGVVALVSVLLVVVATRRGPGLSPDSATYVAGARNLAAGRGLVNYGLQPITLFPPGFPVTLSIGDRLGIDPVDGARWLNALALGVLVILTFLLARRSVTRPWLAVAAAAGVGFAPPVHDVFAWAWTDPVYCVLVAGTLVTLQEVCARRGRSPILIVVAGLLASFGFAYRYAGVTVIAAAILVVVVVSWSDGIKAVLGRAALCAVASLVLPAIISARNLSEGPLFGERSDSVETLSGVLRGLVVSSRGFGVIAFVSVVLALVLLRARGADARSGLLLLPLVVFVSGYLVYIVISELGTRIDPINNRLMSPLFAPTVALVVVCIDGLLDLDWARARPWVTQVISGVVVLVIVGTLVQTARHARARGKSGQGYATAQWQDSELAAAVRALPGAPPVYSNERYGLYLTTGRQPILESPQPTGLRRALARSDAPTYLAVWTHQPGASQFSASRLENAGLRVEETARADDGVLYRVSAP